jgi:hypothetical protein
MIYTHVLHKACRGARSLVEVGSAAFVGLYRPHTHGSVLAVPLNLEHCWLI